MPLAPRDFELELRKLCDSFFERENLPDMPFGALMRGELPKEALRDWWGGMRMWEVNLIFNQIMLPALLERCPDPEGRAILWEVIYPEYGNGNIAAAHPTLARRFFIALGIPEAQLPIALDMNDPLTKQRVSQIESLTFVELLARFLAPETVGPKVFDAYCNALKSAYGMTSADVEFYEFHGREDQKDSALLFELVAKYARTDAEQETVRKGLITYFDQDRLRSLCALRPLGYSFSETAPSEVA